MRLARFGTLFVLAPLFLGACAEEATRPSPRVAAILSRPEAVLPMVGVPQPTIDDVFEQLAKERIPGFGGFYFNENGTPVVWLTDPDQRPAAQRWADSIQRDLGKTARAIVVRQASYDWMSLRAWQRALRPVLGEDDVSWLDIDERLNRVKLVVRDQASVSRFETDAIGRDVPAGALRVTVGQRPVPRSDSLREFKSRPVDGGFQISIFSLGYACTLGFTGWTNYGYPVFVTASHCSEDAYDPDDAEMYQPLLSYVADNELGHEVADVGFSDCSGFEPHHSCRWSDAAAFSFKSGVSYEVGYIARPAGTPGVNGYGQYLDVNANDPRFEITSTFLYGAWAGLTVNKVGRTTGWTQGTITDTCVEHEVGPGYNNKYLYCEYVTGAWSKGGDSGGPFFVITDSSSSPNKVRLAGILRGGPPQDSTVSWFSGIGGIWVDLGAVYPCVGDGQGCWQVSELTAGISGPSQIPFYQSCTWYAAVNGGLPPYSYTWSGVLSGGGESIAGGDLSGLLYLDVGSSDNQTANANLYISTNEEGSC